MPNGIHEMKVDLPIKKVWSFISNMDNWAPLVPGYLKHDILNDRESTWKFIGEIGVVQKTVHLKIDITKWQAPSKVTFNLTGLNENFKGYGYFEAQAIDERQTGITGCLNITARGLMGPMINPVLKSLVPRTTKELTEATAFKMVDVETVAT